MKDKVVKLKDGKQIYVMDEINYMNRRFAFGVYCDNEKGELSKNYLVCEAKVKDGGLYLGDISDLTVLSTVSNLFLARLKVKQKEALV